MLVLSGCNGNNDNDGTPAQTPVPVASSDASLASLTLSDGTLVPAFDPGVTGYAATVDNVVDSITATASPADAGASADVAGTGTSNATVALIEGDNTITVVVTAEDGSTRNYTVTVTRQAAPLASNADLSDLVISAGSLNPIFQSSFLDYSTTVAFPAASTTITATTDDPGATLTIDGSAAVSGAASSSIPLNEGLNNINVVVTAADGTTTQTYTVAITRTSAAALAQTAYLKSSSSPGDIFGRHLAVDGNTVAVGVEWEDRDVSGVNITNPDPDDWFGARLGLDGDLLVSGALNESSAATGVNGDQTDNTSPGSGAVYVLE